MPQYPPRQHITRKLVYPLGVTLSVDSELMKRLLLTLTLSAVLLTASPTLLEGQNVPSNTQGLGAPLFAIPGSTWFVAFEDSSDGDFNDWVGWVSFTATTMTIHAVSSTTAHNVWVSYGSMFVGQTPGSSATIALDATGQVVTLSFWVPTINLHLYWYSGMINSDGKAHAIVQLLSAPGAPGDEPADTPEPATATAVAFGLALAAWFSRRVPRA